MAIDWGILRQNAPVDIAGNFARGYEIADKIISQIHERNALGHLAQNPGDPRAMATLWQANPQMANHMEQRNLQRRKALQDTQDRERQTALGQLYNNDPSAARTAAIDAGDFDLAETFGKLDESTQKRAVGFWEKAGPIAYKLKQTADPAARQALWQQAKPILQSEGIDTAQLDQFDPTNDTQLDAAITTSQKISDLIEQGKITWHQQGEQPSFATDSMGRPVGSQNPYANSVAQPPSVGTQGVASVLSGAGLPPHVVAGFLGNFDAEGGYDGAKGDGGSASGIAQWRGERATNFERVVGKPVEQSSPEEQARFVVWEMQNPEAAGMSMAERDAILRAPTAEAAAALIDQHYERSSGQHLSRRIDAAKRHAVGLGAATNVSSKAEYDRLPSGTPFVAPDGSRRVKP